MDVCSEENGYKLHIAESAWIKLLWVQTNCLRQMRNSCLHIVSAWSAATIRLSIQASPQCGRPTSIIHIRQSALQNSWVSSSHQLVELGYDHKLKRILHGNPIGLCYLLREPVQSISSVFNLFRDTSFARKMSMESNDKQLKLSERTRISPHTCAQAQNRWYIGNRTNANDCGLRARRAFVLNEIGGASTVAATMHTSPFNNAAPIK